MNTTRTGKIARLPLHLRDRVNLRLQNGETARKIAHWLNGRPDVQALMKEHFASQPIRQQNISQWHQGGYQDWLHAQESRDLVHCLCEDATVFHDDHPPIPDAINHWLSARLTLSTRRLAKLAATDPDRADQLQREMIRDLAILQRGCTQSRREQRQRDQLTFQQEQARQRTAAAHERWALHPDNLDYLRRKLNQAHLEREHYAQGTVDWEGNPVPLTPASRSRRTVHHTPANQSATEGRRSALLNSTPTQNDHRPNSTDHPHKPHPRTNGQAAGTVIPSEVEEPHTFASSSHTSPRSQPSEHSSSSSNPTPATTFTPPGFPPADPDELHPAFIRGRRLREGRDPDTGELLHPPSKLPPPVSPSEAAVRKLLGEAHFLIAGKRP